MKRLILLTCAVALADTYPRQPGIDATHYAFRLTFQDATDEIEGEATVEVRLRQDGVQQLRLDLAAPMKVAAVDDAKFEREGDVLRIALAQPARAGETRRFTIRYRGVPGGGMRIMKNKFGERVYFSENWPDKARQWLPMIDHPYDKATSEFVITAPAKYQVIANGLLQEETDLEGGMRRTHWKQSVPIASWLNAVGIAQFSVHHAGRVKGVELQTWVYRQEADKGPQWFEKDSRAALEFFSEWIGEYSYEKLANVEAAGFGGGTEHASAIFYGENNVLGDKPGTGLITHEIAHHWFGDSVTETDWDDVWLSEGITTYCTLLFIEHSQGRDAFVKGLQDSRRRIYTMEKANPEWKVRHDNLADMKRVLQQIIYQKGGWTLHMLRGMIGDEAFWKGLRTYYARFRNASATTADFRQVMEETSGQKLDWFFDQWLNRAGSPAVTGSWRYDAEAKQVIVELKQSGSYRLPLEVAIGDRIAKAELTQAQQTFSFAADKEPTAVTLDPNTKMLVSGQLSRK